MADVAQQPSPQHSKKRNVKKVAESGEHLLETPWTIWYSKKISAEPQTAQYQSHLKKLGTFSSLESFYSYYSHLKRTNEWPNNTDVHIFRYDTPPMWENFPDGGYWTLRMKKRHPLNSRVWEELIFACIGEAFDDPDVVGVVFSTRPKEDVLSVWNKDTKLRYGVSEKLKQILQLDHNAPMEYKFNSGKLREAQLQSAQLQNAQQQNAQQQNAQQQNPQQQNQQSEANSNNNTAAPAVETQPTTTTNTVEPTANS